MLRKDGRRCGLRQLVVNANSGSTEGVSAEAAKPARALQRRRLWQLVVNVNSGSAKGASAEAAKPARVLQRRGRGRDAGVADTA